MLEQVVDSKPIEIESDTYDFLPSAARRSLHLTCLVLLGALSVLLIVL